MRVVTAALAVLLLAPACSKRVNDMQLVCEAWERSGAAKVANPNDRASHTWQWIEANVRDEKVLKSLRELGSVGPEDKAEILRLIAKENGYTGPCPMADDAARPSASGSAQ